MARSSIFTGIYMSNILLHWKTLPWSKNCAIAIRNYKLLNIVYLRKYYFVYFIDTVSGFIGVIRKRTYLTARRSSRRTSRVERIASAPRVSVVRFPAQAQFRSVADQYRNGAGFSQQVHTVGVGVCRMTPYPTPARVVTHTWNIEYEFLDVFFFMYATISL